MIDVADKFLMLELLNRAAYALDKHDVARIEACFSPDADMTVNIAGGTVVGPFEGREAIMGLMQGAIDAQTDVRKHVISNLFFDKVEGEIVHAVSNLTLFSTENESNKLFTTGSYHDQLKKIDGEWKICKRQLDLDMPF